VPCSACCYCYVGACLLIACKCQMHPLLACAQGPPLVSLFRCPAPMAPQSTRTITTAIAAISAVAVVMGLGARHLLQLRSSGVRAQASSGCTPGICRRLSTNMLPHSSNSKRCKAQALTWYRSSRGVEAGPARTACGNLQLHCKKVRRVLQHLAHVKACEHAKDGPGALCGQQTVSGSAARALQRLCC
jgi:hypothetical protein